ncbi:MAG: PAS domain S-box protein [Flavobacteriales bacterium]|nr:PAS domain S-box protein [Flavobacteriales bacterium]
MAAAGEGETLVSDEAGKLWNAFPLALLRVVPDGSVHGNVALHRLLCTNNTHPLEIQVREAGSSWRSIAGIVKEWVGTAARPMQLRVSQGDPVEVFLECAEGIGDRDIMVRVVLLGAGPGEAVPDPTDARSHIAEEVNRLLRSEIRQHRMTQEALQRAERFARSLVDSSLDMIIAVDQEGVITEFNPAAVLRFGWEAGEVVGRHSSMLYAERRAYDRVQRELDGHGAFAGEIENIDRDGNVFTVFLAASRQFDAEGALIGSMGVSRDVTAAKRDREALSESEERYRDLFENATDLIQSVDVEGRFNYVNRAWKRTMGYSEEELEHLTLWDLLDPAEERHCRLIMQELLDGGSVGMIRTVLRAKDGRRVRVEGTSGVRLKNGRVVATRSIFRDITLVEQAREEAERRSAKLSALFKSRDHMFWTVDTRIALTSFNTGYSDMVYRLYGRRPEINTDQERPRRHFAEPDYHAFWEKKYREAFSGKAIRFETDRMDREGRRVCNEIFLSPVFGPDGAVEEVFGIGHEITNKKEAEELLLDSLHEKEVLLKEVHHRVKNNLQIISSILNLQTGYVGNEPAMLQLLRDSQDRIRSMAFIHESLYQTKNFNGLDLADYVEGLARNLLMSHSLHGRVAMVSELQPVDLGLDQAIPCGLILNELISNALKHAFPGSGEGTIHLRLSLEGNEVRIEVNDDGVGMPTAFDLEADSNLGLQLVATLVDQLDGSIERTSGPGAGYLITFERAK